MGPMQTTIAALIDALAPGRATPWGKIRARVDSTGDAEMGIGVLELERDGAETVTYKLALTEIGPAKPKK